MQLCDFGSDFFVSINSVNCAYGMEMYSTEIKTNEKIIRNLIVAYRIVLL